MRRLLVTSVVLTVCVLTASAQRTRPVPAGQWGGTGISLVVGASDASLRFDCADGQMNKQLRMKSDGSFQAAGTYGRSGPGPIRADRQPAQRSVVYKGKVTGSSMTLSVKDSATGEDLGKFTLTKGAGGRIHRCY